MDPIMLAKITPGIDRLELIGEDHYNAVAEVRIGPVKGQFTGEVEVKDKEAPSTFRLLIDQKSRVGNAKANVVIHLNELAGEISEVNFTGDVRLSGMLASMGQRVIGGVVSMLTRQFFDALENEVRSEEISTDD